MMIQVVRTGVVAVDPADGHTLWAYQGPQFNTIRAATNQVNAARSESWNPKLDYIYAGQQDGSVVALKAKTGAPVWTAQVSGAGTYGSASGAESAPFTQYYDDGADGIVLACPNGGESPFRGHMDAYNSKTGALVWRSWTTPDPTQLPYILTWANPAEASQGGAAIWSIRLLILSSGWSTSAREPVPVDGSPAGQNLFGVSDMAVDWNRRASLVFPGMHHDNWDLTLEPAEPDQRADRREDGPVIAPAGRTDTCVLNAANGGRYRTSDQERRCAFRHERRGWKIDD
jgi:glucose dehydrogenase